MKNNDVFIYSSPEDSSGFLLWQIANLRQKLVNVELNKLDLTYVQFIIMATLHWLKIEHEIVNQTNLIEFAKIDKSMTSNVIKVLVEKKIIFREEDKVDTRAKIISLTELGVNKLKDALNLVDEFDKKFFGFNQTKNSDLNKILIELLRNNS